MVQHVQSFTVRSLTHLWKWCNRSYNYYYRIIYLNGTLNSLLTGSESWSFMKKSCTHHLILLSVHWHKDKKSLQTLTVQFGGVKTCLCTSAFSNQGLCWNRLWKLNRHQRNCSFYSSREFGPLFLVQTYQRCVHNRNAMAKFLDSSLSINSWARLWTLFHILDLLSVLTKKNTAFYTAPSLGVKNCSYTTLTQSHHYHQRMTFSEKKCPWRQFHCLRTHANAEQWNSIWLSKNQTCMTISQTVLFN